MYRPPAGRSGSSLRHFCGSSSSISAAAARRGQGEGRGGEAEDSTFRPRPAFRPLACSPRLRHLSRGDTIRSLHAEVCLPSEHGSAQDARVCYSRDTVMGVSFVSANKAFRILLPACLPPIPPSPPPPPLAAPLSIASCSATRATPRSTSHLDPSASPSFSPLVGVARPWTSFQLGPAGWLFLRHVSYPATPLPPPSPLSVMSAQGARSPLITAGPAIFLSAPAINPGLVQDPSAPSDARIRPQSINEDCKKQWHAGKRVVATCTG